MRPIQISPSILSADFSRLAEEIKAVEPFVDMIHLDVMDGHFVPNLTFGAPLIASLRKCTNLPFDVHLMISPVTPLLESFAKAGANILTVHPEALKAETPEVLKQIRALGCKAGVAIKPETPAETLEPLLPFLDLVMVMTVSPGFEGQKFMEAQVPKIKAVRQLIDTADHHILLEVDGGVSPQTAPAVIQAGADILVAASAIFKGDPADYEKNIHALKESCRG